MAALYLHHALFTPESPPLLPQRYPNSDTEPPPGLPATVLGNMASFSTVTIPASDSFKSSHHSEPLLDRVSREATTAFLDIPITSPRHSAYPPDPGSGWPSGPRFERDLSRRSSGRWPLEGIWHRLRRLKLFYTLSYTLIVVWATYNTVRYFISFSGFFSRQRQIISLCLGTSTILCVAVLVSSLFLAILNPCTHDNPSSTIEYTRGVLLPYLASLLLLAPAIANLVLAVMWRTSDDPQTTLRGRCRWDVDVVWSGVGLVCERSPSFVSWIGGAVSRLCITSVVLVTYHVVLHEYRTVCRSAEILDRGPYTWFPKSVQADRRKSVTTAGSGRSRTSRPQSIADRAESISPPPSARIHREPAHAPPSISGDDCESLGEETEMPAGITLSPPPRPMPPTTNGWQNLSRQEDTELHSFVSQLRRMVHQASREAQEGLDYIPPEGFEDDRVYLEEGRPEFDPYAEANLLYDTGGSPIEVSVDPSQVQIFGKMVHRMPTITSIGSGERSSRAPSRSHSGHPLPEERSAPSSSSNTAESDVAGGSHSLKGVN